VNAEERIKFLALMTTILVSTSREGNWLTRVEHGIVAAEEIMRLIEKRVEWQGKDT
jgi:hypothetical protein